MQKHLLLDQHSLMEQHAAGAQAQMRRRTCFGCPEWPRCAAAAGRRLPLADVGTSVPSPALWGAAPAAPTPPPSAVAAPSPARTCAAGTHPWGCSVSRAAAPALPPDRIRSSSGSLLTVNSRQTTALSVHSDSTWVSGTGLTPGASNQG